MRQLQLACLLAFVLAISLFGQHQHPQIVKTVDGATTPDLIPDHEAWRQLVLRFAIHADHRQVDEEKWNYNFFKTGLSRADGDVMLAALSGVREELEKHPENRNAIIDAAVKALQDSHMSVAGLAQLSEFLPQIKAHTVVYGGNSLEGKPQYGQPPPSCTYSFVASFDMFPGFTSGTTYEPQPGDITTLMYNETSVIDNSGCNHSAYETTSIITLPSNAQGNSGPQQGLDATAQVSINTNGTAQGIPTGNYTAEVNLSFFCPYIGTVAFFGSGGSFGIYLAGTAFRNPANLGLTSFPPISTICYYTVTNCVPPSVPQCGISTGTTSYFNINLYPGGCAKYIQSFYIREVIALGKQFCYPVSVSILTTSAGGVCF